MPHLLTCSSWKRKCDGEGKKTLAQHGMFSFITDEVEAGILRRLSRMK